MTTNFLTKLTKLGPRER